MANRTAALFTLEIMVHDLLPTISPTSSQQLLTSHEAAQMLGVSKAFLARDRWGGKHFGQGPLVPFIKVGPRAVRYMIEDLRSHIAKSRVA